MRGGGVGGDGLQPLSNHNYWQQAPGPRPEMVYGPHFSQLSTASSGCLHLSSVHSYIPSYKQSYLLMLRKCASCCSWKKFIEISGLLVINAPNMACLWEFNLVLCWLFITTIRRPNFINTSKIYIFGWHEIVVVSYRSFRFLWKEFLATNWNSVLSVC